MLSQGAIVDPTPNVMLIELIGEVGTIHWQLSPSRAVVETSNRQSQNFVCRVEVAGPVYPGYVTAAGKVMITYVESEDKFAQITTSEQVVQIQVSGRWFMPGTIEELQEQFCEFATVLMRLPLHCVQPFGSVQAKQLMSHSVQLTETSSSQQPLAHEQLGALMRSPAQAVQVVFPVGHPMHLKLHGMTQFVALVTQVQQEVSQI